MVERNNLDRGLALVKQCGLSESDKRWLLGLLADLDQRNNEAEGFSLAIKDASALRDDSFGPNPGTYQDGWDGAIQFLKARSGERRAQFNRMYDLSLQ